MQFTRVGHSTRLTNPRMGVYADLDALLRLQFVAAGFSLLPRQPVHSILFGRQASRLRGRGLNFEELRNYVAGDDIRYMDWKATARSGRPQVRVYSEERDRAVWLLVNQGQSLFFGSAKRMKSVVAAEVAALVAWRVLAAGDRIGAVVFNDSEVTCLAAQRSRKQVMRILAAVVEKNHRLHADSPDLISARSLNSALELLLPLTPHDCLICLIGDGSGINEDSQQLITQLNAHNDVMSVFVYDPLEASLPGVGALTASDGRSRIYFNTGDRLLRERFQAEFQARLQQMQQVSRLHAIPMVTVDTVSAVIEQMRQQLGYARQCVRA